MGRVEHDHRHVTQPAVGSRLRWKLYAWFGERTEERTSRKRWNRARSDSPARHQLVDQSQTLFAPHAKPDPASFRPPAKPVTPIATVPPT